MFLNPALSAAIDRISERADDVRRAFTPGAVPNNDDVATAHPRSDFTLDPLAVVAPDDTYFLKRGEHSEIAYTRDGTFALRDGRLVDGDGRIVYGVGGAGALCELRIDAVDEALGRVGEVRIERDGTLAYQRVAVDPRSGGREPQRVIVGRVALARFPAGTRLKTGESGENLPPPGVSPQIGAPNDGRFGALVPMHRERSRIDLDASLTRLKNAYLAFDALHAAETAKGNLGKTAMDLVK
jgi:flagellar basal body rod protein FlgG